MLESNKKSINYDMLYFDENPYYSDMITDYERNMAVTSFLIIIVATLPYWVALKLYTLKDHFSMQEHVAVIAVMLSAILAVYFLIQRYMEPLRLQKLSADWETVEVDIIDLKIKSFLTCTKSGCYHTYVPQVAYSYIVGGREYHADRLTFDMRQIDGPELDPSLSNQYHEMNALFATWAKNKKLTAYIDLRNPQKSVVLRDLNRYKYYVFIIGLSIVGVVLSIVALINVFF